MRSIVWMVVGALLCGVPVHVYGTDDSVIRLIFTDATRTHASALHLPDASVNWLTKPTPLFEVDSSHKLQSRLDSKQLGPSQLQLTLTLTNPTDRSIRVDVTFPVLRHLGGGDPSHLTYCFPGQRTVVHTAPVELSESYGGGFPLQFIDVHREGVGGVYLLTCDTDLHRKRYFLNKQDAVSMGVTYLGQVIAPGHSITLPAAILGAHGGDWHQSLAAYRRWVATWYKPTKPRQAWFRRIWNFRQMFLYPNMDMGGLYDPTTGRLQLTEVAQLDARAFGGIDYVHLFDWSQTPRHGRVGDYDPWEYLPRDRFTRELRAMQSAGMRVGLYYEGYLLSRTSQVARLHGQSWQMLNADGRPHDRFGTDYFYACPAVKAWGDDLTASVLRAAETTGADGFYIDQFGFGYQYPCFNPAHGHAVPSNQVRAEAELIGRIRRALHSAKVLYTEQTPVDVATQYQDGSFSYTLLHARGASNASPVDLARFAFPDFKVFQILHGDGPIGDDVLGVKLVFFNGEGIWLAGPSDSDKWFPPQTLATIRKTHALLRRYTDAFASLDVTPLVPTLVAGVDANRFAGVRETVWTFYNATDQHIHGPVLQVPHRAGTEYYDAWNNRDINALIHNGQAVIDIELKPHDVGCIIRQDQLPLRDRIR